MTTPIVLLLSMSMMTTTPPSPFTFPPLSLFFLLDLPLSQERLLVSRLFPLPLDPFQDLRQRRRRHQPRPPIRLQNVPFEWGRRCRFVWIQYGRPYIPKGRRRHDRILLPSQSRMGQSSKRHALAHQARSQILFLSNRSGEHQTKLSSSWNDLSPRSAYRDTTIRRRAPGGE